jgi:hypothetical protein
LRRLVHLALLLLIITVVRACGGVYLAEDRLNAATRWTAERTGLASAKDTLDTKVRPAMAAATRSLTDAIYGSTSRTMDSAEVAAGGFGAWLGQQLKAAVTAIETSVGSVLSPNDVNQPPRRDDPASGKDRRDTPSR